MLWNNVALTRHDCKLACALSIYIRFEDGTPLDEETIGKVVGETSGLSAINCTGLVDHLRQTSDVYPEVLAGGEEMVKWVRDIYNKWLDSCAAPIGQWP